MAPAAVDGPAPGHTCKSCGAPMQPLQDWCLNCGAGQPGSLSRAQGWRAGAVALALAALLVVGASVAAYAALTKPQAKHPKTLAQRPLVPGTTTPAVPGTTPTPTPTSPGATPVPGTPGTPTTIKATPPKIPLQTPTPKSSEPPESALFPPATKTGKGSSGSTGSSGSSNKSPGSSSSKGASQSGSEAGQGNGETGEAEGVEPILLDTNAASVYNPYNYSATMFGDPSQAIDGEASTAWTAAVDPAKAPNMADGLVLDLRTSQKLSSAKLDTTTKGLVVEIYGANGSALPTSITDPAWKRLSGAKTLKKKDTTLKLKTAGKSYRYVVLWLVKAPVGASSVAIHELELFS